MKKSIYILFVFLLPRFVFAQVADLSQQLITSWGAYYDNGTLNISASAGEAVIITVNSGNNSLWLTQGFQQPLEVFSSLATTLTYENSSCIGNNDGKASVTSVSGGIGPYTYLWTNGKTTASVDSLPKGSYTVIVSDKIGQAKQIQVTISEEPVVCGELKIYHGFTPNGDNYNDTWKVSGILNFPDNEVTIYNRWGDKIWEAEHYDNSTVVWKGESKNGNAVEDGTYYYVFKYGDKTSKGWVEVTR